MAGFAEDDDEIQVVAGGRLLSSSLTVRPCFTALSVLMMRSISSCFFPDCRIPYCRHSSRNCSNRHFCNSSKRLEAVFWITEDMVERERREVDSREVIDVWDCASGRTDGGFRIEDARKLVVGGGREELSEVVIRVTA